MLWNSLEIAKLLVSILTPLSVVILGWFISRRMKRIEQFQWANQKLIEKRLLLYDQLAPQLNKLLCFYIWVGNWKDISPKDITDIKRELDKVVSIYRYLFSANFYERYRNFMDTLFIVYTGPGLDAKIRSCMKTGYGDRRTDSNYQWQHSWESRFADEKTVPDREEIKNQYDQVMNSLKNSIGL